jgi:hypothetical protein
MFAMEKPVMSNTMVAVSTGGLNIMRADSMR